MLHTHLLTPWPATEGVLLSDVHLPTQNKLGGPSVCP